MPSRIFEIKGIVCNILFFLKGLLGKIVFANKWIVELWRIFNLIDCWAKSEPIIIQAVYLDRSKLGISGTLVYHPIMLCFLQQERPVSLLSGSKNRTNLSCIEHILQNV